MTDKDSDMMHGLRGVFAEAIEKYLLDHSISEADLSQVVGSVVQIAATMAALMPGGTPQENMKWGLKNFVLTIGSVTGTEVCLDMGERDARERLDS